MRLSLSLQTDVLKVKAGNILNTFKIYPRRDVLFFEDILANYIRECEKAGFGNDTYAISKEWSIIGTSLIPKALRAIGSEYITNTIIKKVWTNLGLLDDFRAVRSGDLYVFSTKNEFITRVIGENFFMQGGFAGAAAGFHGRDAVCCECTQAKDSCRYAVELRGSYPKFENNKRDGHGHLNAVPQEEGFSLKKALLSGFFKLEDNRLTFRGKTMLCLENSGFHLLGNRDIMLDRLSAISASFFRNIIRKEASSNSKLVLLKNILQACGWGRVAVVVGAPDIKFCIAYPPRGMQAEADNWDFLAYYILGYLHILDKKIVFNGSEMQNNWLLLRYSRTKNRKA